MQPEERHRGEAEPRTPRVVMLMRQFHPIRGGYENQALRLAEEMRKVGISVDVVTLRHRGLSRDEVHRGVPIHRLRFVGRGHLAALSYLAGAFLWMARRRRRFQLIHANRSTSGLIAGLAGFVLRKPVLYKLTRGDEIEKKGLRRRGFGGLKTVCLRHTVDRFVAITSGMEEDLGALGIPAAKIVRIPNGIDLPAHRIDPGARASLGIDPASRVATFVGRLISEKGVDWLLEAWTEVSATDPSACLVVAGDGPERGRLEAASARLGLTGSVRFLGHRDDVDRILTASDLFILPSRLEGVSNALLEAMAHGLPVIVGDDTLGGNREVVRHDVDGLIVSLDDRRALATAIARLFHDAGLRERFGAAARETVRERFSIESVAARYRALYGELLATKNIREARATGAGEHCTGPRNQRTVA